MLEREERRKRMGGEEGQTVKGEEERGQDDGRCDAAGRRRRR